MSKNSSVLLAIIALLGSVCGSSGAAPLPDETLENALDYRGPHAEAFKSLQKEDCPYFLLTKDGIGYLKTSALSLLDDERPHKTTTKLVDGLPDDWWLRPSFLKSDNGWTKITKDEAHKLWGDAKERFASGWHFFTFDVRAAYNGEANTYHVDLQFDPKGGATAYRIRGIGINKAKWVTKAAD